MMIPEPYDDWLFSAFFALNMRFMHQRRLSTQKDRGASVGGTAGAKAVLWQAQVGRPRTLYRLTIRRRQPGTGLARQSDALDLALLPSVTESVTSLLVGIGVICTIVNGMGNRLCLASGSPPCDGSPLPARRSVRCGAGPAGTGPVETYRPVLMTTGATKESLTWLGGTVAVMLLGRPSAKRNTKEPEHMPGASMAQRAGPL